MSLHAIDTLILQTGVCELTTTVVSMYFLYFCMAARVVSALSYADTHWSANMRSIFS